MNTTKKLKFTKEGKLVLSHEAAISWLWREVEKTNIVREQKLLHYVSKKIIQERVQEEWLEPGELIISQRKLVEHFGWPRTSLRRWLGDMEDRGVLIIRRTSIGAYTGKMIIGINTILAQNNSRKPVDQNRGKITKNTFSCGGGI